MTTQQLENENITTYEQNVDNLVNDIQEIRSRICTAFLISFAVIAIPALAASLSRINDIGWQPVMLLHIAIAISLWFIAIFRSKVPHAIQASFIVMMFFIIGLGGIYQFGLVAGGVAFLVVSSPTAALLFNGKTGIATLAIGFIGVAIIGLLTISGNLKHGIDLVAYAVAPSAWLTAIFGWGLASTTLTIALYVFNKNLINTLKLASQHQEALLLSEERLESVLEGSQQGFWDWNIDTGEVKRNDRWAQMLSYSTIKDFEDNTDTWTNSIHPDDRDAAWKSINDHLEGRTSSHKMEYRMLTKGGGYKWILDHAKIVQRDSNGKPLRMSGTHIDISDRKQMEEEREQSIKSLKEALHEIKTLKGIIPICSYCHSIRDDEGAWGKLEAYISKHSDAEFSHGVCPKCLPKARAEAGLKNKKK